MLGPHSFQSLALLPAGGPRSLTLPPLPYVLTIFANWLVERRQSLILWGPSRLGKTVWARSLGKHAYYGGLFSLDEPLEGVSYAIFDDFGGLKFLPTFKFWLGHQKQFYVTDKYKGKKLIDWGKPSIWLSNSNPLEEFGLKAEDVEWLQANCTVIELTMKVAHANTQ